jgi:hypothetical protein
LCEDSDDNGGSPNTNAAAVSQLLLSIKRPRDNDASCNDTNPRLENGSRNKTATGSAEFRGDLELTDEVEVQKQRERRGDLRSVPSVKNDTTGNCAQTLEGVHATTEKEVGALKDRLSAAWNDRLSELADYRKIHGHCNVPYRFSENTKLGQWVSKQRQRYWLRQEGKKSPMTTFRIQELERLSFEWRVSGTPWEDRLKELAEYRKIHGHCNVLRSYNSKLAKWVDNQRGQYRQQAEGKTSPNMAPFRIQALESLGLEWEPSIIRRRPGGLKEPSLDDNAAWVRERAKEPPEHNMQKIAAVEKSTAVKSKSPSSPSRVKCQKRRRVEATDAQFDDTDLGASPSESAATASLYSDSQADLRSVPSVKNDTAGSCAQTLEGVHATQKYVGTLKDRLSTAWNDRLSELADYRKIHGHCNVPYRFSENPELGQWVSKQRQRYWLRQEGKPSAMTISRIQELERLGFKWRLACSTAWEDRLKEFADYRKIHGHCSVSRSDDPKLAKWVERQRG